MKEQEEEQEELDYDDPLGILRTDRDAEIDSRLRCDNCGRSYHAKWSGTTCSACDGRIGEVSQ